MACSCKNCHSDVCVCTGQDCSGCTCTCHHDAAEKENLLWRSFPDSTYGDM